jgi:sugar phosphate isomerase/epimerase
MVATAGVDPRLSVSAVSSWTWTLDEDLRFWESAGIEHVGLSFRKLRNAGLPAAADRVRDAGLRVSNIVELGWWSLDDRATWGPQQARLVEALDAAVVTGAACLVLTSGPQGRLPWDDALVALGEALAPVLAESRARGVTLTLENTGPLRLDLSFVTTLRDAIDAARVLGIGACMEVNSCFAERALDGTIAAAVDVLEHVQVNDFVIGSLCTPDRAVPGDGDIPLERILRSLAGAGYRGAFELELVGPRIEAEGYEPAIARGAGHISHLLRAIDDR